MLHGMVIDPYYNMLISILELLLFFNLLVSSAPLMVSARESITSDVIFFQFIPELGQFGLLSCVSLQDKGVSYQG